MAAFFLNTNGSQWLIRPHHNHGTDYHTMYIFRFICCSCWRVCICNQLYYTISFTLISIVFQSRRDRDRMVVGFTTICAISIYHHWIYEFLPIYLMATCTRYYVIKFVSHLWRFGGFLHQYNWPQRYSWNIVESGTKYHKPIYYFSESYLWWYYKRVLVKSTLFFIYCGLT